MDRLLRWWWSDPFTRHIHPSSQITVPDFVRRRIREVLDWPDAQMKASALRDVVRTVLCAVAWPEGRATAQGTVRTTFNEPHYLVPLEPPNAGEQAKANRQYELTLGLAEDCFLGARLVHRQRRRGLAKQVLTRARRLDPANELYRSVD